MAWYAPVTSCRLVPDPPQPRYPTPEKKPQELRDPEDSHKHLEESLPPVSACGDPSGASFLALAWFHPAHRDEQFNLMKTMFPHSLDAHTDERGQALGSQCSKPSLDRGVLQQGGLPVGVSQAGEEHLIPILS